METHIEGTIQRVLILRVLIQRVQNVETCKLCTMYGNTFKLYNVLRLIGRVQCMESHIYVIIHGGSYRG